MNRKKRSQFIAFPQSKFSMISAKFRVKNSNFWILIGQTNFEISKYEVCLMCKVENSIFF